MSAARLILGQGTGVDLTPVPAIAERLEAPGTVFARVFTDREWAYCLGLDAEPLGGASGAVRGGSGAGGSSSCGAPAVSLPLGGTSVPVNGARSIELHAGSQAFSRPGPRALESLGARWAAKEAMIKAWSSLIAPNPPTVPEEEVKWSQIEVVHDRHRRPSLRFSGDIARVLKELSTELRADLEWSVSLSHEGGFALAFVQVLALADPLGLEDRSPSS
ncbi:holo-ACP synthase [Schaalia cardiffensis]|uniref:holo-ACP synthase n=1 Tax=Schaalia cardiffensis TaxID=181487 RepID=UPI0023F09980|nr:holo-ACP synthase [Schaalia cardiffensis]